MARIEDAKVRETSGGYDRLFGNRLLGRLFSKVHSTVISSGVELEKLILARIKQIENLDEFVDNDIMPDGVFIASKREIKKSNKIQFSGSEPDFMIFKRRQGRQHCHIVELKDGHTFDTKKARAEHSSVHAFIAKNAQYLPFVVSSHFCAFNQDDKQAILRGFKGKINIQECMTGREFCSLLELDYDEIIALRKEHQEANLLFFVRELLKIDKVKLTIEKLLRG